MNFFSGPYRKLFIVGLLVQVVTAWFSVGYFHPDEHYQVLEFCNYKLGFSPLKDLPWEYLAHCRGALQPAIAYLISKILLGMGCYNPFIVAFLLRLLTGILTWYAISRIAVALLPEFHTEKGRFYFIACSLLLWFVPYIGVRFSAETLSADLFLIAISILIRRQDIPKPRAYLQLVFAGLLLGFALFFRLQIGFAFLGLAVWFFFIRKCTFTECFTIVGGAAIAIGLSILVDHWFYGEWVLTPLNYFNVNIIQHVAAKFGVDPWWYYFVLFLQMGILPLSIVLLLLFFKGIFRKPKHVLTLACITFLVGHFLIGHKEMRFLFPMSFPFIFLSCIGLDQMLIKTPTRKVYVLLMRTLVVINVAILFFKMVTPAEEVIKYYNFIYNYSQLQNTTIISLDKSPYKMDVIECNFYKPQNLAILQLKDTASLHQVLREKNNQSVIYLSRTLLPGPELAGFKTEKLYCEFPDWLLQFNVNHWEDRSYIWAVFRLMPE